MSAGFSNVATEDSDTLLDVSISLMRELSYIFDEGEQNEIFQGIFTKLFGVMSDRASVNKKFGSDLNNAKKQLFNSTDLHYLYCNAHFLLGLASKCEQLLKKHEILLEEQFGRKLGRARSKKFDHFKSSESATARLTRLGCDFFGPRGDQKNGCKSQWLAYCVSVGKKSHVSSFRMNRFNNFFEGAGKLYHHYKDIIEFLSNMRASGPINQKLESVFEDITCEIVRALMRALGIIYYKISGPYWLLIKSDTQYVDFFYYVQKMHCSFKEWSVDSSPLLNPEVECVFPDFSVPKDSVFDSLYGDAQALPEVTKNVLQEILTGFVQVTEKQLVDFLPGGIYGMAPSAEVRKQLKPCPLSNLVSEYAFGDLDYDQQRRRQCSMHHHSTLHMLKNNKTISKWLDQKCENIQGTLLNMARRKASNLHMKHKENEKLVRSKLLEKMKENVLKREKLLEKKLATKQNITKMVKMQGGPCRCKADLVKLLSKLKTVAAKKQALIWETKFLKEVIGVPAELRKCLVVTNKDVAQLQEALLFAFEQPGVKLHDDAMPLIGNDTNDVDDSSLKCTNRKKQKSVAQKVKVVKRQRHENSSVSTVFHPYKFTAQGEWIAIAYEDNYYVGCVIYVHSDESGDVKCLKHVRQELYRWPEVCDDIAYKLDAKHVFMKNLNVTSTNFRIYHVKEHQDICVAYKQFTKMHNYY